MASDDDSLNESDKDSLEENLKQNGFCHFNEDSSKLEFEIDLFGHAISIKQSPVISELGHGKQRRSLLSISGCYTNI